jgi:RND family efflux transporter MFP subunit
MNVRGLWRGGEAWFPRARRGRNAPCKAGQTAFAVLALLTCFPLVAVAGEKPEGPQAVEVKLGTLRIVVRATGHVVPRLEMPVTAPVTGRITVCAVKAGQLVKKDQLLLEVEAGSSSRALERAQAELVEAEARARMATLRAAEAERQFARKRGELTTYTLEFLRQESLVRQSEVRRAKLAVEAARAKLKATRLLSPIDGVVTECTVRQGQRIAPAAVETGQALLTVCDFAKIAVLAEVDETQVRDIQPNLAAGVVLPAFPERRFQGRIVSISYRGQNRNGKVMYPIRIALEEDPGDAARIGLTARVEILAIEKPNVLLLDNRAIRSEADGPHVVVLDQDKPKNVKVRLGRSDGAVSEVLEGLREGDRVILP